MFTSFDQFLLKQQQQLQQQQQNGTNNNSLMTEDKQQQSLLFTQFTQQETATPTMASSFLSATAPGSFSGLGSSTSTTTSSQLLQSSTINTNNYHYHDFAVNCSTYSGETVAVTGDCNELGNWKYNLAFVLEKSSSTSTTNIIAKTNQQEQTTELWTGRLLLPTNRKIKYRYFVCMILDNSNQLVENGSQQLFIMRRWESNCLPRIIDHMKTKCCLQDQEIPEPQEFGYIDMNVLK